MEIKYVRAHIEPTALDRYFKPCGGYRPGHPNNYTRPGGWRGIPDCDYPLKDVMCYGDSGH